MSKKNVTNTKSKGVRLKKIRTVGEMTEYVLTSNNLRVLHIERKGTGVVTSNIIYKVGSRDEKSGDTGIAHMLEHMLFRPTKYDRAHSGISGAILFDGEVGAITNANTWKDRTTYYFSYPKKHFERALRIEAERMRGTILTKEEFDPEQRNVLSEYDMYAGDDHFALAVDMSATAFFAYPYHHETIGFRNDIERLSADKLKAFYDIYYRPNNAVLMIIGDIRAHDIVKPIIKYFGKLEQGPLTDTRSYPKEPKQEGVRRVTIERKNETNILTLGFKHAGFPSTAWYTTMMISEMLGTGKDSILYKELVETGKAISVSVMLEEVSSDALGIIYVTLAKGVTHSEIESKILACIPTLSLKEITQHLKKTRARLRTSSRLARENSLGYTAELVEYVSSGNEKKFYECEEDVQKITPRDIQVSLKQLFNTKNMTIGYSIGVGTHEKS